MASRWVAAATAVVALVGFTIGGCAPAPTAPAARPVATRTAPDHDHDHDHAGHDHDHDHAPPKGDRPKGDAASAPARHEHADQDDDHDHPKSLAEGVKAVVKLAGTVAQHVEAGVRDPLDEAVHDMGHLLEDVTGLVRSSPLAQAARDTAQAGLDELFECYDAVDTALHATDAKAETPAQAHARVAARITAALEQLGRIVADGAGEAASGAGEAAKTDTETRQ